MTEVQAGELSGSSQTLEDHSTDVAKPARGGSSGPGVHSESARQHGKSALIPPREQRPPWVAFACYAVAVVSLPVSLNTSWRFFDRVLHIPTASGERYVMFAVAELALVVCGAGMAISVQRDGRPGSFRAIVWAMCSAMAYMAWAESATEEAIGRILLGPVLGTVMLHLGLGLELRTRHHRASVTARVGRELQERCLSWMGLSDDERDAAQRTRDRKAYRAATLSRPQRWPWSRQARLERTLLAAGVADDPIMRDRLLSRLAVVCHADALATLTPPSPWAADHGSSAQRLTNAGSVAAKPSASPTPKHSASQWASADRTASSRAAEDSQEYSALHPIQDSDSSDQERAVVAIDTLVASHEHPRAVLTSISGQPGAGDDGLLELAGAIYDDKVSFKSKAEILAVLRLWDQKVPTTTIAEQVRVHRDTVKNIVNHAQKLLSDAELLRA